MEIALKVDSWHYKLHMAVFKKVEYQNFCPYFWLTIFLLLISPLLGLLWFVRSVCRVLFAVVAALFEWTMPFWIKVGEFLEGLEASMDKNLCIPLEKVSLSAVDETRIYVLYKSSHDYYMIEHGHSREVARARMYRDMSERERRVVRRRDQKFQLWKKKVGPDWKSIILKISDREKEETTRILAANRKWAAEQEERREAFKARRKKILNFLVAATRHVAPVVVTVIVGAALYVMYLLGVRIWPSLVKVWDTSINVLHYLWAHTYPAAIGKFILWTIVLSIILTLIYRTLRKCDMILVTAFKDKVRAFFRGIHDAICWVISPITAVVEFIVEYAKMYKKDHCPKIIWE